MQVSKPLNRKVAIGLALAAMWLLASIGVVIFIHSGDWWFLGLHGHDATTIQQIGTFFLAWTAAQLPAAYVAGFIICLSDFIRPLRATFLTMAAYQILFSLVRAVRWPWTSIYDLDQSFPVLAYLISISFLVGFSVFITWFMPRLHRVVHRDSGH